MTLVAGADGYKHGWFLVLHETSNGETKNHCLSSFNELLEVAAAAQCIAIDIPIGLLDMAVKGGRAADKEARKVLSPVRSASVFTPPVRAAIACTDYQAAKEASLNSSPHRISLSRQAFGICEKIYEVDSLMTPERQEKIKEVHPELSFLELNDGKPLAHSKKSHLGFLGRLSLLQLAGFEGLLDSEAFDCDVPTDDVLDAYACCWTARRIFEGKAACIPETAPVDALGLKMEIWR